MDLSPRPWPLARTMVGLVLLLLSIQIPSSQSFQHLGSKSGIIGHVPQARPGDGRVPAMVPSARWRLLSAQGTLRHTSTLKGTIIDSSTKSIKDESGTGGHRTPIGKAYGIYKSYLSRLWSDTSEEERRRISRRQAGAAVRRVQHLLRDEANLSSDVGADGHVTNGKGEQDETDAIKMEKARTDMLEACHVMLEAIKYDKEQNSEATEESSPVAGGNFGNSSKQVAVASNKTSSPAKKKKGRSVFFGAAMGALVACWVFSGNYIFTGLFTLMTILGQLEYYRMVINTGVIPARSISVLGAASMFIVALVAPDLHQVCLPLFALATMAWFLTMRRQVSTIPEISTTFTGMFLLGYIPSFWVKIRMIGGGIDPTQMSKAAEPLLNFFGKRADALPAWLPSFIHLPITTGAIFIFWTWLSLAFSDVGAYFFGRKYGKTKLGDVAPAAGAASPNKTVEGVIGGCAISASLSTFGAWVQGWPYWCLTGPIHGIYLGALGLLGDLTASMIKRDADIKDFGDLLPEHGGVMDRVDSYIFTAPYSWVMCKYLIPVMTEWRNAGYIAASAGLVGLMSVPLVWFFTLRRFLYVVDKGRKKRQEK